MEKRGPFDDDDENDAYLKALKLNQPDDASIQAPSASSSVAIETMHRRISMQFNNLANLEKLNLITIMVNTIIHSIYTI